MAPVSSFWMALDASVNTQSKNECSRLDNDNNQIYSNDFKNAKMIPSMSFSYAPTKPTTTTAATTTTTEFRRNYFTSPILKDKVKENALGSALAKVRGFNSDKYGLRRFVNLKNFATSIENAERVYDVKNINNHFRGNYSTRPQKKKGFEAPTPFKHKKTTLRKNHDNAEANASTNCLYCQPKFRSVKGKRFVPSK